MPQVFEQILFLYLSLTDPCFLSCCLIPTYFFLLSSAPPPSPSNDKVLLLLLLPSSVFLLPLLLLAFELEAPPLLLKVVVTSQPEDEVCLLVLFPLVMAITREVKSHTCMKKNIFYIWDHMGYTGMVGSMCTLPKNIVDSYIYFEKGKKCHRLLAKGLLYIVCMPVFSTVMYQMCKRQPLTK